MWKAFRWPSAGERASHSRRETRRGGLCPAGISSAQGLGDRRIAGSDAAAFDLARPLRSHGWQAAAGGFHPLIERIADEVSLIEAGALEEFFPIARPLAPEPD